MAPATLCPHCSGQLSVHVLEPVHVDRCTQCGAHWFDSGELSTMAGSYDPPIHLPELQQDRLAPADLLHCPSCNTTGLRPFQIEKIPIRVCYRCRGALLTQEALDDIRRVLGALSTAKANERADYIHSMPSTEQLVFEIAEIPIYLAWLVIRIARFIP